MTDTKHINEELLNDIMKKMIHRVSNHMLKRIQHDGAKYDESYPFSAGNSLFWFVRDKETHTMTLGFNESPRFWDIEQMEVDILVDEHNMFVELGVII